MTVLLAMSPLRTRTFLLALIFIGIFYYYSDEYLHSSSSQDFVAVPDTSQHGGDPDSTSTDLTTYASEVLLVSAFFPLNHSHRSDEEHEKWLGNFLDTIQTPIYLFTPPEIAPLVKKQRGSLPITINSSYSNPFDVPPVRGLYDVYHKMRRQSKDRKGEEPGLYALRTSKSWFLSEAVKNYESRLAPGSKSIGYVFWVDIGSFQDGLKVHDWPNIERVKEVFKEGAEATRRSEDEFMFFPMNDVPNLTMQWWKEEMGPFYRNFAQGVSPLSAFTFQAKIILRLASFFGGTPNAVEWWKEVYLKYHDYWLFKRGAFVGQDRTMFNSLSLLFPGRIITVWPSDPYAPGLLEDKVNPLGVCGDMYVPIPPFHYPAVIFNSNLVCSRWYFRYFLSSQQEQRTVGALLKSRVWRMPWQIFSPVEECRLTRVLGMEDVLRRNFGSGWNPPMAGLDLAVNYRPNPR